MAKIHLENCFKCGYKFPYAEHVCGFCGWDHYDRYFHKTKHFIISKVVIIVKDFFTKKRRK